jgi:hypothetical protein
MTSYLNQADAPMEQTLKAVQYKERRSKPRINCAYPAIVQGWDADGQRFRANATLTNMSASGLCLTLNLELQPGRELFVLFRCSSTGPLGKGKAPLIAVDGNVIRSDNRTKDTQEVALKIHHNRFL